MEIPTPPQAVVALAAFVRDRLAEVPGTIAPLWARRDGADVLPALGQGADHSVVATARQLALVLVGAAAPFAPTSYSRARLIRQMHASGLLTDEHLVHAQRVLEVENGQRATLAERTEAPAKPEPERSEGPW
jgi:hypothetical protein